MIFDNIQGARQRIEAAASKSGRDPSKIELVAVTKYAAAQQIVEALKSGHIRHIGESRVQDAVLKRKKADSEGWPKALWRMIGHLQSNKAKKAVETFDTVDSLDSLRLGEALEAGLAEAGKTLPVLIQVKLGERQTQSGIAPESLEEFVQECRRFSRLRIQGLMTIAPMLDPVEAVRPYFRKLKELSDQILLSSKKEEANWTLSMGMSRDFEIAVEEGATMVRLGSELFDLNSLHIAGKHSKGG